MRERYNGPEFPTYRHYVHNFLDRGPLRVELVVFYGGNGKADEIHDPTAGLRLGWFPDAETSRRAARDHRKHGRLVA